MTKKLYISKNNLTHAYYFSDRTPEIDKSRKEFSNISELAEYFSSNEEEILELRERRNLEIYLDIPSEDREFLKPALKKFRKARIFRARK